MKQIIPATEAIAILKFKQEENNSIRMTDPQRVFNNDQINYLQLYLDGIVSDIKTVVNEATPTRERHIIHNLDTGKNLHVKAQMIEVAPEVTKITATQTEHVEVVTDPEPTEVLQQILNDDIPEDIIATDEALKDSIKKMLVSGNKIHAYKMIEHFFGDKVKGPMAIKIFANEILGIDPFRQFKLTIADINKAEGYTAAFTYVKNNLPSAFELTGDDKLDNVTLHRFTRSAIDAFEPSRVEAMAKRKQKNA